MTWLAKLFDRCKKKESFELIHYVYIYVLLSILDAGHINEVQSESLNLEEISF